MTTLLTPEQVAAAAQLIDSAHTITLLTHMSPDGDAMGSSLGLMHYLRSLGKDARVILPNSYPAFLGWMPGASEIVIYEQNPEAADQLLANTQLLICTDFNEPKRVGSVGDKLPAITCPKILIDHHLHPFDFADVVISYPQCPSASELVYRLIEHLPKHLAHPLTLDAGTCIYTGMMTDTGNFSFSSNHPEMYEIIARLVSLGVDKDAVYNAVYNAYSADRMRLTGYCLFQKMRIYPQYHTALIYLTRQELYRFNFQSGDAEGIVNMPLQIKDVYYSIFMREDRVAPSEKPLARGQKLKVKISLRSQGDRPVNIYAHEVFGGGGHANASGGEFYGNISAAVQRFLNTYTQYFRQD